MIRFYWAVWIATGHRFRRVSSPTAGTFYIPRSPWDLAKSLWHGGIGLSLYAKRATSYSTARTSTRSTRPRSSSKVGGITIMLKHRAPALIARLQATSSRGGAGFAIRTSFARRTGRGAKTNHQPTSTLDHPMGARQLSCLVRLFSVG